LPGTRPYDVVTFDCYGTLIDWERGIREAFARIGPPADPQAVLADWPPFGDTNAALDRLAAAGYRLGILSNVDDDLLAGTRRHFRAPFDIVITAQQVRAYKPAVRHFEAARRRVEGRRWLHAAQSYFHDVAPARAQDVPVAWINRKGERPGGEARPDREFRTLAELADWLAPAA
jgi:FMN phosphatase YigB (HAD superfamily)